MFARLRVSCVFARVHVYVFALCFVVCGCVVVCLCVIVCLCLCLRVSVFYRV